MENLIPFTLFGSIAIFNIVVLLLFIFLISSDRMEDGTIAVWSLIVALGMNFFWGTFPILSIFTLRNVLAYVFAGFIYSLVRTYFKGKELKGDNKKHFNLKDHVFRWWLLFPICLINWLFSSLLRDLYEWIYSKISSVYTLIFNIEKDGNT